MLASAVCTASISRESSADERERKSEYVCVCVGGCWGPRGEIHVRKEIRDRNQRKESGESERLVPFWYMAVGLSTSTS
ncbi:hypothetical protein K505DRAFT_325699 [Melanomma pulvis-pyrius CBS 109.77]|uniref:Uncharacterized protein n=1 Tax=Melanomma pulvis-pyrius CBS 109.77 TaxID=1314802 RepID=A0A6A6XAD0_9PLEO|nr:hypothetical protein K505DRAFT_325699 [Melanomma pulvis-pyrius CBS 109.77]